MLPSSTSTLSSGPALWSELSIDCRMMQSDFILLIVGKDDSKKTFLIPRHIVSRIGMLLSEMKLETPQDGSTITVELPDDSSVAFIYLYFYYFFDDVKFPPFKTSDCDTPGLQRQIEQQAYELCQTWVLGDKYRIPGLQNCAMFRLCRLL